MELLIFASRHLGKYIEARMTPGVSFIMGAYRYWKLGFNKHNFSLWREFGFFYGGALIYKFCQFIESKALSSLSENGTLFFLARDGDIIKQVYDAMYGHRETKYLYASRRCMTFPCIEDFSGAKPNRFLSLYSHPREAKSAEEIFSRFNYDDLSLLKSDLSEAGDTDLRESFVMECIRKSSRDLLEKAKAERRNLVGYLGSVGFTSGADSLVVDVGWNGTIQDCLDVLVGGDQGGPGEIIGCYLGVSNNAENKANKSGYLFSGHLKGFDEYLDLIEFITASPKEGVESLKKIGSEYVPVDATSSEHEELRREISKDVQAGILDFANLIKDREFSDLCFVKADDFKLLFDSLKNSAHPNLIDAFSNLKHSRDISGKHSSPIVDFSRLK